MTHEFLGDLEPVALADFEVGEIELLEEGSQPGEIVRMIAATDRPVQRVDRDNAA